MLQNSLLHWLSVNLSRIRLNWQSMGTFITLAMLVSLKSASHAQANSPRELEAEQFLRFVNNAQQARYLKYGSFAQSFEQIGQLGVSIVKRPASNLVQTVNYSYEIQLDGNKAAHIFAVPLNSANSRSYIGVVVASLDSRNLQDLVCKSVSFGERPVRITYLPNSLFCPAGTMDVKICKEEIKNGRLVITCTKN